MSKGKRLKKKILKILSLDGKLAGKQSSLYKNYILNLIFLSTFLFIFPAKETVFKQNILTIPICVFILPMKFF